MIVHHLRSWAYPLNCIRARDYLRVATICSAANIQMNTVYRIEGKLWQVFLIWQIGDFVESHHDCQI